MLKINFNSVALDMKLVSAMAGIKTAEDLALGMAGKHLAKEMQRTIKDQTENWTRLDDVTISLKGHDMKLLENGEMVSAIDWKKKGNYVTIGVHDDAGDKNVVKALVHEHGNEHVPERSFIMPTWDREKKHVKTLFGVMLKKAV
jgi:hypothetical protein